MKISAPAWWPSVSVGVILALAVTTPAFAQGKTQGKGKGSPPSRNQLPSPTSLDRSSGATPFAWMDDASLLTPGGMWFGVSLMRWAGTDVSEVDFPIVDVAIGLAPRLQVGANIPRVVGSSDPSGAAGGRGTTYFNAKVGLVDDKSNGFKVAVAPTVEIMSAAAQAAAPDQSRLQFGLPVSAELDSGSARLYASTGFFSRGVWFFGAGTGWQATPRLGASLSFSRSWSTASVTDPTVARPNRNEVSGGVSYLLKSNLGAFGSVGHTVATDDANGAGMTMSIGLSIVIPPGSVRFK